MCAMCILLCTSVYICVLLPRSDGAYYVCDTGNNVVRKVTPAAQQGNGGGDDALTAVIATFAGDDTQKLLG